MPGYQTLNLLVVGPYGETTSGPSRVITEVVHGLSSDIHVVVVSPKKRRDVDRRGFVDGNVEVVYQACGQVPGVPGSHNLVEILRLASRLRRLEYKPNLVWVHSEAAFWAYWLSKFRRTPCVATIHGVFGDFYQRETMLKLRASPSHLFSSLMRWLQKTEFRKASVLTTYSDYLGQLILAISPRSRVVIIPNGVNTTRFQPLNEPREKIILYVGRMAAIKGVHVLVESMKKVARRFPEWRLWLVGGALDQPISFFERFMDSSTRQRIEFLGAISNAELPGLLSRASIFVMPTLRDGFEIALMEAMASGIPCITTAAYERKELYGGYAESVPPNNPDALAETLMRIIQDYGSYDSSSARKTRIDRARQFDWSRIAHKYENLFRGMAR